MPESSLKPEPEHDAARCRIGIPINRALALLNVSHTEMYLKTPTSRIDQGQSTQSDQRNLTTEKMVLLRIVKCHMQVRPPPLMRAVSRRALLCETQMCAVLHL